MVVLIKIVQVILALSLLVLFHEFGHYTFAKLFKTRVEKFYLFFNPRRSLLKFKRFDGNGTASSSPLTRILPGTPIRSKRNMASDGCRSAAIARLPA